MKNTNLQSEKGKLSTNSVMASSRTRRQSRSKQLDPSSRERLSFPAGQCPQSSATTMRWLITLFLVLTGLTACTSPEATRTRGGGPGADVGNRTKNVRMHEGSFPFWETPRLIEAEHPSLAPAHHAAEFSRK